MDPLTCTLQASILPCVDPLKEPHDLAPRSTCGRGMNGSPISVQTAGTIEQGPAVAAPPITLHTLQIGATAAECGGGSERYYFNLLRALPGTGVSGAGLVSGDASLLTAQPNVSSFAPDATGFIARWSALRREVDRRIQHSDLVVSHFAPYAFPIIDKIRTRPLVVHFHGSWALESAFEGAGRLKFAAKHFIERVVYSRAARFIVLSRASAAILEREYNVAPDDIRIIPGGVDVSRFSEQRSRQEARSVLGWPADRPTILTVRRLVRSKGIENLIDAVDIVRRGIPDVLLMIAGTGPLRDELAGRVHALGLERWVQFIGQMGAELPTVYRAADISIVPSIALEGFGLVVIEALACGTPTLVTPVTGLPEVVNDLDPALVLAGMEKAELARGITDALTGRVVLPTSADCIQYAERFDWREIAARIAQVYREVV